MGKAWRVGIAVGALALGWERSAPAGDPEGQIRLNQIQVIGSHNSYHVAPHPNVQNLLGSKGQVAARAIDYTHRPLAEQFAQQGVRQIELDVFADPAGGRYARPSARQVLRALGRDPGPDPNAAGLLREPGFKVFHIQDIDYLSTTPTLAEAFRQVHDWSASHPRHAPILILIELKDDAVVGLPTRPAPFGAGELDALDRLIRSSFPDGMLIDPDAVRGPHATLPEAIRDGGWPTLRWSRGKVLVALDNDGDVRDRYLADHPSLAGRAMFANLPPGHPGSAWVKHNDALAEFDAIRRDVAAGYLVRTRADVDTTEARRDDPTRRDHAFASGAQFISTDFPDPRPELSPYRVRLPGDAVARVNPVNGPHPAPDLGPEL